MVYTFAGHLVYRLFGQLRNVKYAVGAENLCHLAGCSADRWLFGPRRYSQGVG
jgi:hypothetical protein